jgi:hypothetical protein
MDDQAIVEEVQKAIWALGGRCRPMTPLLAYLTLERLGADPDLLALVGAWRESRNDKKVLEGLQEWNHSACEAALAATKVSDYALRAAR